MYSEKVGRQVFLNKNSIDSQKQSDKELWNAFKEGSLTAFGLIYEQNIDGLLSYGNNITPYHSIASDCIQDLFVDLWKKRAKLGPVNHLRGYLFICYKRRLLDSLKRQKKIQNIEHVNGFEILLTEPIIDWDLDEERKEALAAALNALPYQAKEAIYLRFFNDLPCSEIAAILNIKTQSVYNLISSGLKTLRGALVSFEQVSHLV